MYGFIQIQTNIYQQIHIIHLKYHRCLNNSPILTSHAVEVNKQSPMQNGISIGGAGGTGGAHGGGGGGFMLSHISDPTQIQQIQQPQI